MNTAIHIGASKEAIKEARIAILAILAARADTAAIIEALITLRTLCAVNGTTVSNCTFGGKK